MFAYDGRLGDLYRIFLVNLLLTIVTLGIWRFWAITRIRRYLWSRTSCQGDRLEYDGTGGQLFLGVLFAFGIIIGMFIVAAILSGLLAFINGYLAVLPILLVYLAVLVLALGAPFSAQRYRLGHTIWRGIRGGMQGSMVKYGLRSLLYTFAVVFTLFQLQPWASIRLLERRMNASAFGSVPFVLQGKARAVYPRFLLTIAAVVALGIVLFGGLFAIEGPALATLQQRIAQPGEASLLVLPVLAYIAFIVGASLIGASYQALFYRHITASTTLGPLRFGSAVSGWSIVRLTLGNLLLLAVTLGFGLPVVIHRNARFFTTNLLASGTLDPALMFQNQQPVSRYGEGMFQALDAGSTFT